MTTLTACENLEGKILYNRISFYNESHQFIQTIKSAGLPLSGQVVAI